MREYILKLKIKSLKNITLTSNTCEYYILICYQNGEVEYTKPSNLLYSEEPFLIQTDQKIQTIEIWKAQPQKIVSKLTIHNIVEKKMFKYEFQKHNLELELYMKNWETQKEEYEPNTMESSSQGDCEQQKFEEILETPPKKTKKRNILNAFRNIGSFQ